MNGPLLLFLTIIIGFILWMFVFDILFPKSGSCRKTREGLESAELYPSSINDLRQIYGNIYFDTLNGNVLDITRTETVTTTTTTPVSDATTPTNGEPAPEPASETDATTPTNGSPAPAPAPAPETDATTPTNGEVTKITTKINMIYSRDKGGKVDISKYIISGDSIVSATASADTISSSYDQFSFTTQNKINVFYIAWDTETYIHVIDLENPVANQKTVPQNVMTFVYDKTGTVGSTKSIPYTGSMISINTQAYTPNISDNRMHVVPLYDYSKSLYKIVDKLFYDVTNGSLITQEPNGFNVYERKTQSVNSCATPSPVYLALDSAEPKTGTSASIIDVGFTSWVLQTNNFLVLYIGNGKKTIVSVLNKQTNANEYSFVNTVRYFANGTVDNGTSLTNLFMGPKGYENHYVDGMDKDMLLMFLFDNQLSERELYEKMNNPLSDYYKWVEYWNASAGTDLYSKRPSSEYILKSQIVPPVCPKCPSCPSVGVCTTCGGNGGSGTQVTEKVVPGPAPAPAPATSPAPAPASGTASTRSSNGVSGFLKDTGSGVKELVKETGSGVKEVAYDTVRGTKTVARDVYGEVKDVAGDVYGEAKGIAGGVYGEAKGIAGGVYGEAKDIAGDVYGGVKGLLSRNPVNINAIQTKYGPNVQNRYDPISRGTPRFGVYSTAPQTEGSDHMTYFGALQPKGDANYIPVTADFSAFRK